MPVERTSGSQDVFVSLRLPWGVVEHLQMLFGSQAREHGRRWLPHGQVRDVTGGDFGLDALLVGVGDRDDLDLGPGSLVEVRGDLLRD